MATIVYLGNASSIHTTRWAEHFASNGWKTHLISFSQPHKTLSNITVHRMTWLPRGGSYVTMVPAVKRLLREIKPDIVHAHYLTGYGGLAGRAGFTPLVLSAWGSDVLLSLSAQTVYASVLRRFIRPALDKASAITSESGVVARALTDTLHVDASKVHVFPWGADRKIFHPHTTQEDCRWKTTLSIPADHRIVLSSRSILPNYNIDQIVQAIPRVTTAFPKTVFVFLCGGVRSVVYYTELINEIKRLGLTDRVRLVDELLAQTAVAELLRLSDVLVSVPTSDSLTSSVIEAMCCGVVPICSRISANFELCGVHAELPLIEPDKIEIANAIIDVLGKTRAAYDDILEKNGAAIAGRLDWAYSCDQMTAIYSSALRSVPIGRRPDDATRSETRT